MQEFCRSMQLTFVFEYTRFVTINLYVHIPVVTAVTGCSDEVETMTWK